MTGVEGEPVRVMKRDFLLILIRTVADRKQNYGRPTEWVEANVLPDALIPLYVMGNEGMGLRRCVVAPLLKTRMRGLFSIDLRPQEISQLPVPSEAEARRLLREFLEYAPPIRLTPEQLDRWKSVDPPS